MLEITTKSTNSKFTSEDDGNELFKTMLASFKDQKFCDVTLISSTEGIKVKAHRMVLAAASEYFRAMFGGSLKEADAEESIELKTDTVENIVKASHLFQLNELEVICSEYLTKQLDLCNCLGITLFAEHYNYKTLYETSFAFALQNFMKLRSFGEFFLLDADHLIKIISSDELRVSSEEFVFHSIMAWIDFDTVNRDKYLVPLIRCLRLTLLQPQFIADTIEKAVCKSSECKDMVFEAYKWHSLPFSSLQSKQQIKLRSIRDVIIAISGWSNTENVLSVGLYYDGFDKWIYTKWPGPPEKRSDFGSTTLGDKLIIAGGKLASGELSNHVDCLNLKTLEWTRLSPLVTKRHSCGLAVLNGCIYAVGGKDYTSTSLNSVEQWDPLRKVWKIVTPMPEAGIWPNVGCKKDLLCVLKAELSSNSSYRKAFTYNPDTKLWSNWLSTSGNFIGMATLSVNGVGHHICMSSKEIVSTNLETNVTTSAESPKNNFDFYEVAAFRNRIIFYNSNKFNEYGLCGILKMMPTLQNNQGKLILISN